jgi:hypothetical protein
MGADLWLSGAFVLADQPAENRSTPDSRPVETRSGMIGTWRTTLECSMWPAAVVVDAVPGEDGPQVAFAEDQDAVGEFGSDGQHEAFGEAVRSRASRRDLHRVDAGPGQDRVDEVVNWPARLRTRNRKVAARSSRSISRLRACWVVQAPVGWLVAPRMCT